MNMKTGPRTQRVDELFVMRDDNLRGRMSAVGAKEALERDIAYHSAGPVANGNCEPTERFAVQEIAGLV